MYSVPWQLTMQAEKEQSVGAIPEPEEAAMLLATIATLIATPPVVVGALLTYRRLTSPPAAPSRHRLGAVADPYRPCPVVRAITTSPVPVIPGLDQTPTEGEKRARMIAVPAQRPISPEMKALAARIEEASASAPADVEAALTGALDEKTREVARIR